MTASYSSKLQTTGQQVLDNNQLNTSAFMQMRQRPPPANFSQKALSFYSNDVHG